MKKCSKCRNYYPDSFGFCPLDAVELESEPGDKPDGAAYPAEPAQIKVRTLLVSVGILVLVGMVSFLGVFCYRYMKPT